MVNIRNFALVIAAITSIFTLSVFAVGLGPSSTGLPSSSATYVGQWSNGRGETLAVTATTIRFANDKAVKYRDVTKVTNGREFHLEVTSEGKLNYLTKFLSLSMGEGAKPDEMKMTLHNSYKDMVDGANSQGEATWYRDK
jgi:hypothetical protein